MLALATAAVPTWSALSTLGFSRALAPRGGSPVIGILLSMVNPFAQGERAWCPDEELAPERCPHPRNTSGARLVDFVSACGGQVGWERGGGHAPVLCAGRLCSSCAVSC